MGRGRVAVSNLVRLLDLPDETAFHERVEAIVNGRVGNLRHRAFGADENFLCRRVIAFLHDHVIDVLALRREPKAAGVQSFTEILTGFFLDYAHRINKISMGLNRVKI